MEDFKLRLKGETEELIKKYNALQNFMRTERFYDLDRENKDLLYDQAHAMLTYLQILGKRCELLGIKISLLPF